MMQKLFQGIDRRQLLSAKIMQRSNVLIMPLVFASFMTGMLSEYEQVRHFYAIPIMLTLYRS